MMEPVAWRNEHGAVTNFKHGADAWRDAGIWSEPLVRLSDAEARIAELETKLALVESARDHFAKSYGEAEARAEAAEALLKEAMRAMDRCEHDGGFDREIGPIGCSLGDKCVCIGVYPILARAIHHKIGVKDE